MQQPRWRNGLLARRMRCSVLARRRAPLECPFLFRGGPWTSRGFFSNHQQTTDTCWMKTDLGRSPSAHWHTVCSAKAKIVAMLQSRVLRFFTTGSDSDESLTRRALLASCFSEDHTLMHVCSRTCELLICNRLQFETKLECFKKPLSSSTMHGRNREVQVNRTLQCFQM